MRSLLMDGMPSGCQRGRKPGHAGRNAALRFSAGLHGCSYSSISIRYLIANPLRQKVLAVPRDEASGVAAEQRRTFCLGLRCCVHYRQSIAPCCRKAARLRAFAAILAHVFREWMAPIRSRMRRSGVENSVPELPEMLLSPIHVAIPRKARLQASGGAAVWLLYGHLPSPGTM